MDFQPELLSTPQLLQCYSGILAELRKRGVIRTANSPLGDYAEWLVAQQLDLQLVTNSTAGYDALDAAGHKYQIKSRRITPNNSSRQLSVIRNLPAQDFDYLIAVIFDSAFQVQQVVKVPHAVIGEYATYREHVNGYVLQLRGAILSDQRVEHLTHMFV